MHGNMLTAATTLARLLATGFLLTAPLLHAAGQPAPASASPSANAVWHARYSDRYKRSWGVDIAGVRVVSSGYMLRFSYRIVDPEKSAQLFDKKSRPYLLDMKSGARLAVPTMENVGELRQTATPVMDRTYFIIFGNPGKLVQPGNSVSIVIGDFHADDLIVD
jgi:hypothetical protein